VISDYDTSARGELLVSTFTAGMHPINPMSGHILPVIFFFHFDRSGRCFRCPLLFFFLRCRQWVSCVTIF